MAQTHWLSFIVPILLLALMASVVGRIVVRRSAMRSVGQSSSAANGSGNAYRTLYRTRDGAADYGFSIERCGGEYRVYITRQPAYGRRDTSLDATHRLRDGGRYYVCWTRPIRSVEDAKAVARAWAESTQRYVRSGQRF